MKKSLHAVLVIAGLALMNPVMACDGNSSQEMHLGLAAPAKTATQMAEARKDARQQFAARPSIEAFE